ncbi:MAG: MBL fold metallo-hydrolase [Isosphaeraceae bacterium]|nr:MBL fold metallo-hydrolase [Isosphaeraceae bacterium]
MPIQFAVLASGSRGNATLVRAEGAGLLIDFGIGPRAIAQRLESVGAAWDHVASALLTHTHGDHVDENAFRTLAKHKVTLHCHEGHRAELARYDAFEALSTLGLVRCYDERPFLTPGGMRVEPLALSHDGGPTFGFRLEARPTRKARPVSLGYLADTGCWTETMADALTDVDLLGVEFNHDVAMQKASPRSPHLIARNLGDRGHLSNDQGAGFVGAVLDRSSPGAVRHLVLLHLSQQCNDPALAVQSAHAVLRGRGRRVNVHAALQAPAHPNLSVEPRRRHRVASKQARRPHASRPEELSLFPAEAWG